MCAWVVRNTGSKLGIGNVRVGIGDWGMDLNMQKIAYRNRHIQINIPYMSQR